MFTCLLCSKDCGSEFNLKLRLVSKAHAKKVISTDESLNFCCLLCNKDCGNESNLKYHLTSKAHAKVTSTDEPIKFCCLLCSKDCGSQFNLNRHRSSKDHAKKQLSITTAANGPSASSSPAVKPIYVDTSCSPMKWPPAVSHYFAEYNRRAYVAQLRLEQQLK